jgi:hypothetical protein
MMNHIRRYPVRYYALVVANIQLATAYGLDVSAEQNAAIMAVVAAVLSLVAENFTKPADNP